MCRTNQEEAEEEEELRLKGTFGTLIKAAIANHSMNPSLDHESTSPRNPHHGSKKEVKAPKRKSKASKVLHVTKSDSVGAHSPLH